jgi:tRNA splicing ligase
LSKKKRGHFCKGCGDFLPNEKFSGKGHREHLCNECKKEGIILMTESNSDYDRNFHRLSRAIRNCLIVYKEYKTYFLFEYKNSRYIIGDELNSEIYEYRGDKEQKFHVSDKLQKSEAVMDVLYQKYYQTIDSDQCFDYEELMYDENVELSKKRKQYMEVISFIRQMEEEDEN